MAVYAVRGENNLFNKKPSTPKEVYTDLNEDQFIEFARCYLKINVMDSNINRWFSSLDPNKICEMNNFFESIPDYMMDFSTDTSRKLLLMFIKSNIEFGFNVVFQEQGEVRLFNSLQRLLEIDPRLSKK